MDSIGFGEMVVSLAVFGLWRIAPRKGQQAGKVAGGYVRYGCVRSEDRWIDRGLEVDDWG